MEERNEETTEHVTHISSDQFNNILKALQTQESDNSQAYVAGTCLLTCSNQNWIVDSGATDHICSSLDLFKNYKVFDKSPNTITIADGKQVTVEHVGDVFFDNGIELQNVLHVPGLKFNLISTNRLCRDLKCEIVFTHDKCIIQGPTLRQSVVLGKLVSGLYAVDDGTMVKPGKIETQEAAVADAAKVGKSTEEAKLWHLRMGHMPFNKLHLINSVFDNKVGSQVICQVCHKARQTRKPFPVSLSKTEKCFELLHIDTWGPYKNKTYDAFSYFLTIVDDFSRNTWTFLMRNKTDVVNIISDFLVFIKTQYSSLVLCIRSDNAKELCEGDILLVYRKYGIKHQRSCPNTPQQNGIVERKHRHLLETARALYFQSRVPIKFWGECLLTATHIINRMPLRSVNFTSPYELLNGKKPDLAHLKVFGCLCYISTLKTGRAKFDKRASPCVLLGYPPNQKAFKVYDLETKSMVISRDVIFYEKHLPFHYETQNNNTKNPIFLPINTHLDLDMNYPIPEPFQIPPDNLIAEHDNIVDSAAPKPSTTSAPQNIPNIVPSLRQSDRIKKRPAYLDKYVCAADSLHNHWCNIVQFDALPSSMKILINKASEISEPLSYLEASQDTRWIAAMNKELDALAANDTWELVPLPKGKKPIGCKWVYKVKLNANGSIERLKARLVAQGFTQKYGIDYLETFSPVVKMATVRCLLALAASKKWNLYQLDINNAFLHGELTEEVYMKVPPGVNNPHNYVCKLTKSLYGLKQASRQWYAKLNSAIQQMGYKQSKNDYSLFIKDNANGITVAVIYVDDIIVTGSNEAEISLFKEHLHSVFSIKDLGTLNYFLGMEICHLQNGIVMTQKKFTKELLLDCNMDVSKVAKTPLPANMKLLIDTGDLYEDPAHYRKIVGKLNFLGHTRPDLSFSIQTLSQFMHQPRVPHVQALHHVLRYVSHTLGQGILLCATDHLSLKAYSDSDWATCPNTRRSVTGYVLLLGKSLVSWKSKKQSTLSRSSSEAEYRTMAAASSETTWLVRLLTELGVTNLQPVTLYCDNQSAIHIGKNPVFHERTKHIEIDCHFTRDKVLEGLIQLTYTPSADQLADIMTKALGSSQHNKLKSKLGMYPDTLPSLRGDDDILDEDG